MVFRDFLEIHSFFRINETQTFREEYFYGPLNVDQVALFQFLKGMVSQLQTKQHKFDLQITSYLMIGQSDQTTLKLYCSRSRGHC